MAGYVASARLQGGVPHFVGGGGFAAWSDDGLSGPGPTAADELSSIDDPIELVGRPLNEAVGDWLASLGESWSQLTFFLFDPESWR